MSLIQDENRWMEEQGRDMESGLSQVPAPCDCSVMHDWIVESGLGQFGIRETNDDCRVIARCDTFKDAMRIAKLLNAETPNSLLDRSDPSHTATSGQ